ncbi:Zn-dependent alcohol dehydrogenase [Prauserella muralis]|uniref:Alcohol dehydrogenase n=1 Tax=Prauserella muralis TaxID=588067 RepID=A0A2V4AG98_9PSEU|nr:Zn-dependent alcohol dehydrogenase [Prauserella muralis]PXY18955.1 alcohol dehydrogenase [Prauserella muralis]TWE28839.1 S-(hydroxymethyl)glutathione dehydrogenase/alcohol dehydrogenase [Prauserella muralis]
MRTRTTTAAVLHRVGEDMSIEELDVAPPQGREVLLSFRYAGLCRSDLHVTDGTIVGRLPLVLGHEGSAVVDAVGPLVSRVEPGDHVVCSFIPSCGQCRWCASGRQVLCDTGAGTMRGHLPGESWPLSGRTGPVGAMCQLGTFSQLGVVHENSVVRIDASIPLDVAALAGCGVPTGWGSAVNAAAVRPGEVVVVLGAGGIGMNAVQGARAAGAREVIVVEPVEFKRDASHAFGASTAVSDAAAAREIVLRLTGGAGADKVIVATSVVTPEISAAAVDLCSKGGTVVITAMASFDEPALVLPTAMLTMLSKTIRGTMYGDCSPSRDIPALLALYQEKKLLLEELITRRYRLEQVNDGYQDLEDGALLRGLVEIA